MQLIEHFTLLALAPPKRVSILALTHILKVFMESFSTIHLSLSEFTKKKICDVN